MKIWPWLLVAAAVLLTKRTTRDMSKTARGIRNNNPGNIRKGKKKIWNGEVWPSQDSAFSQFMTMAYGVRALLIDLTNKHKSGLKNVQSIIFKYAPPSENYSQVYANFVADAMGIPVTQNFKMTEDNLVKFAKAVARFENGADAALINAQAWEEGKRRALSRLDVAQYIENQ